MGACALGALAALPAPGAASDVSVETPVASAGVTATESSNPSASATLSVADVGGKASELLQGLTAPQLAALAPLVAGATETGGQLRAVVSAALADLGEDGGIAELAHELGLPPAALEGAQLSSTTAEGAAHALGTTVERLSSVLAGAGAITQPLTAASPLLASTVERVSSRGTEQGTSLLVGTPAGNAGVTLTTVTSSRSPGAVAGFRASSPAKVSNAFSILSIKVTKTGAILETVRLPGRGRVSATASATKQFGRRSTRAHTRTSTRRVNVASASAASSGGTLTLTLRPRGLSRTQRTRVAVATTYTPTGGSPRTLTRFVSVGRRGSRHHR